jgi:hypothetical protein
VKKQTICAILDTLADESLNPLDRMVCGKELVDIADLIGSSEGDIIEQLVSVLRQNGSFRRELVSNYREMEKDLGVLKDPDVEIDRMLQFLSTISPEDTLQDDRKAFRRWMDSYCVRERARYALHRRERLSEITIHLLRGAIWKTVSASKEVEKYGRF